MDQYEVDYNILTVVTSDVAEHIEEVYEEYRKTAGITSSTFPVWIPWRKDMKKLRML